MLPSANLGPVLSSLSLQPQSPRALDRPSNDDLLTMPRSHFPRTKFLLEAFKLLRSPRPAWVAKRSHYASSLRACNAKRQTVALHDDEAQPYAKILVLCYSLCSCTDRCGLQNFLFFDHSNHSLLQRNQDRWRPGFQIHRCLWRCGIPAVPRPKL